VVVLDTAWAVALPGAERLVRRAARAALAEARKTMPVTLAVALADDRQVRALNARDRGQDKPTNVLAYPSNDRTFLGDVVVARQTVWREAKAQGKTPREHLAHLVIHGTLHLVGHDHERSQAAARRMEALERRILRNLGIGDPYTAR
jgi:probable rRNA maturation factor